MIGPKASMERTRLATAVGSSRLLPSASSCQLLLAIDFRGRNDGCARRRRQSRAPREVALQHLETERRAFAAGAAGEGVPRSPSAFSISSASRLRAHVDGASPGWRAVLPGRIDAARARADRHRHLRQILTLDHEDLDPVVELRGLHVWRVERPVLAERGAFVRSTVASDGAPTLGVEATAGGCGC